MSQTVIQKNPSLRFGSTKIELGDDAGSLVNLGAIRAMRYVSKAENSEVEFDNCPSITKFMKGDRASFQFSLAEVDFTTLSKTDDGLINVVAVAGTPVTGATQSVGANTKAFNELIVIENQMGNGNAPSITSVVGSVDGALVANTDFFLLENSDGKWGIIIVDSATVTTMNQSFVITYDYTPNASKKITFNTTGQKLGKYARITNTDNNGKKFTIDLSDVTNITAIELPFISDNTDDVMVVEMELEGTIVEWIDEQSVS